MQQNYIIKYCALMDEVKRRMTVINSFGSGTSNAVYMPTTVECVYLQFRKILELIAFGSLIANQKLFSQVYTNFSSLWNARRLLEDLEKINANFYPQPITETPSTEPNVKSHWIPKANGFLTQKDFVELYQRCGKVLHSENPFGTKIDYNEYNDNIQNWITKIIELTGSHTIRLVNDPNLYLIHMQEARDDKAHGYVFAPAKI